MAITNFIPTIWSENLYQALDAQYIGVANCSRDYEGDIKNMGDTVKICGVGSIIVNNYTKNSDMNNPQTLSDTVKELTIDQAKYFNFQIDDVDRAQSNPKLMEAAMKVAASALAAEADRYVYSLCTKAATAMFANSEEENAVVNAIINARQKLYENNVSDTSGVVVEVSPAVASLILKSKVELATDNTTALEHGYLGSICGCKIYVSNNIVVEDNGEGSIVHKCLIRTKRAIAFAEQLSEIDAYRPEKRFADAVKGLHLYGCEMVYPKEAVLLEVHYHINEE